MPRKPVDPRLENDVSVVPEPPTHTPPSDARHDPKKQKENRDNLGVDDEHKTPEMEKGHRGTFP